MKSIVALILLSASTAFSAMCNTSDSAWINKGYFLDLSGVMTVEGYKVSDYTVSIFKDGVLEDTMVIDDKREQYFELELNHNYAVKFRKTGYKERIILVDTHLPEKVHLTYFTFRYSIEFIPVNAASNTFDDFPVAYVTYDKTKKDFDYNRNYHANVRMKQRPDGTHTASNPRIAGNSEN